MQKCGIYITIPLAIKKSMQYNQILNYFKNNKNNIIKSVLAILKVEFKMSID